MSTLFSATLAHLRELHLVHALASVPVEEGLAPEHRGELLTDPLEQFLHISVKGAVGVGVTNLVLCMPSPGWRWCSR